MAKEKLYSRKIDMLAVFPRRVRNLFIIFFFIYPLFFMLMTWLLAAREQVLLFLKIALIVAPPVMALKVAFFIFIWFRINKKITTLMQRIRGIDLNDDEEEQRLFQDDEKVEYEKCFRRFPYAVAASNLLFDSLGGILAAIVGAQQNLFFSIAQGFFMSVNGVVLAAVIAAILYYFSRVWLYPSNRVLVYRALPVVEKFSIPLLSVMMVLMLGISIGLYSYFIAMVNTQQEATYTNITEKRASEINGFYLPILKELQAYANTDLMRSMELEPISIFLQRHLKSSKEIEMYFVGDLQGRAPTSVGKQANIKSRLYHQKIVGGIEPYVFSDFLINRATGTEIFVAAAAVKDGEAIKGLVGATVLLDTVKEKLDAQNIVRGGHFLLYKTVTSNIIYSHEKDTVNKSAGDVDKMEGYSGIQDMVMSAGKQAQPVTYGGIEYIAFLAEVDIAQMKLVLLVPRHVYYHSLNAFIAKIIVVFILVTAVILVIIQVIALRLAKPIANTITIFRAISEGDLTVRSDDYIPDQFGELIRYLQILLRRLNDVIHTIIISADQLNEAANGLAQSSQELSSSAQDQAASVEEATAALEETTGSIDRIAEHSKDQSSIAKGNHEAMEALGKIIREIGIVSERLRQQSGITAESARQGNAMMKDAIGGMDRIDESTASIAEFVNMISDISEQVNLLALNASIEAARAGDHGRGFAVVADEISKLADQTSQSAKSIAGLVEQGRSEVLSGKEYVNNTSRVIFEIIDHIQQTDNEISRIREYSVEQDESSETVLHETRKVMEMADSISVATDEQMTANNEMLGTVTRINDSTQSVSAGATEVASSAEEISAQAESLKESIQFFKVK